MCIDNVDHGGQASCKNYEDIYEAAAKIHREENHENKPSFEKDKHTKIMKDLDKFQTEMDKKCGKNTYNQLSDVDKVYENFNKKSIGNKEDELKNELELKQKDTSKKTKEKLMNRTIGNRAIEKVSEAIKKEKSNTTTSLSSSSVSNSALNPIKNKDTLQKQEFDELERENLIKKKGGNPTKNKTKRRRTKNNTRKMKQKRRTIKKT